MPQVAALLLASYRVLSPWLRDDKVILLRENKLSHPSQFLKRFWPIHAQCDLSQAYLSKFDCVMNVFHTPLAMFAGTAAAPQGAHGCPGQPSAEVRSIMFHSMQHRFLQS